MHQLLTASGRRPKDESNLLPLVDVHTSWRGAIVDTSGASAAQFAVIVEDDLRKSADAVDVAMVVTTLDGERRRLQGTVSKGFSRKNKQSDSLGTHAELRVRLERSSVDITLRFDDEVSTVRVATMVPA